MDERLFTEQMDYIVQCIRRAGYDPYEQLSGYIETNNEAYITRTGDARMMVMRLHKEQISLYLQQMKRNDL